MSDPAPAPPEKPKSKGSKPGPPSAAKEVDRSNEINAPSRSGARQLRTAVAKPAEIYTAQWGKGDDAEASPKPKKGTHDDDIERVVGKRRRSGRTEYLVKWGDGSPNSWEAPRTIDPALVEQYEEKKKRRQMSSQAVGDDDGHAARADDLGEAVAPPPVAARAQPEARVAQQRDGVREGGRLPLVLVHLLRRRLRASEAPLGERDGTPPLRVHALEPVEAARSPLIALAAVVAPPRRLDVRARR